MIGCDGAGSDSSRESLDNLVMAGGDGDHVGGTVAQNVREGLDLSAMTAGWISVRPAALDGVGGNAVEAGTVDEPPVLESDS